MKEGKSKFNPCLFGGYVYVCGGKFRLVEAFSPQTDRFLLLRFQLPEALPSFLYVHHNCLVVHNMSYVTKFKARRSGQLAPYSQVSCPAYMYKYSNSQPVLDSSRSLFYIIRHDGCFSFHMETGDQERVFRSPN